MNFPDSISPTNQTKFSTLHNTDEDLYNLTIKLRDGLLSFMGDKNFDPSVEVYQGETDTGDSDRTIKNKVCRMAEDFAWEIKSGIQTYLEVKLTEMRNQLNPIGGTGTGNGGM